MDPASLSNLDPKLKETYERVMGTATPTGTTPDTPPAAEGTPSPQPTGDLGTSAQPTEQPPAAPQEVLSAPVTAPPADVLMAPVAASSASVATGEPQTVTIDQQPLPNPTASNVIGNPHGHQGLIKIFYILGATVFFVIYIFFWMKIFNFSLPF